MKTLTEIQKEVHAWSLKNFGDQPSYRPLLGIVEEGCGEILSDDRDDIIDAIGDTVIYCLDYAAREGITISDASDVSSIYMQRPELRREISRHIAKLCHAHLKQEQQIRNSEDHQNYKKVWLQIIIDLLKVYANSIDYIFDDIINVIWNNVQARDWTKNKKDGKV